MSYEWLAQAILRSKPAFCFVAGCVGDPEPGRRQVAVAAEANASRVAHIFITEAHTLEGISYDVSEEF